MSIKCPAGCGKKFINEYHIKRHMEVMHKDWDDSPKQKGWVTPYGFSDFKEPVTYEEALETMKIIHDAIDWNKNPLAPKGKEIEDQES